MTHPTDTLRLVPTRDDGLRVGRAILEAHSQWEKEHGVTGSQNPWQEQHIILLGQAAILAAPASALPGGGWQELVDEIMQRAKTCEELITDDGDDFAGGRVSGKAQAYKHSAELIRAFLARNGKGEEQ